MNLSKDIDLLLIGKTGNGKSALGNTILRRKAFISKSDLESVTRHSSCEVSEYNGRIIKVVDCPGVADNCHDAQESFDHVVKALEDAVTINPRGYHAFILVAKYGARFTAEEQNVIRFLKKIFGDSFVRDFCILVLTCGDLFNKEVESKKFEDWCKEQDGDFKELVTECKNRVILFDNRTKDTAAQDTQLNKLITTVDDLRWREKRYTNELFQEAQLEHEKLKVKAGASIIEEETLMETSLILALIECTQGELNSKTKMSNLKSLSQQTKDLYEKIVKQDKKTGCLKSILETVEDIQRMIANEMKIVEKLKKDKETLKKKAEKTDIFLKEESKKLNEKYERLIKQNMNDDKRRQQLQIEQENKVRKLEKKMIKEREEREKKLKEELDNERRKQRKMTEEIEKKYRLVRDAD